MLLDSNQAFPGVDSTKVFMSWMANSKREIQSMLRQLSLESVATEQEMAISGFAGRSFKRLPQQLPEEAPIVCYFLDYECETKSG